MTYDDENRLKTIEGMWPQRLECGDKHIGSATRCQDCGIGAHPAAAVTWAYFGFTPLCRKHATKRYYEEASSGVKP